MFGRRENPFPDITIAGLHEIEELAGTPFTQIISINNVEKREEAGAHVVARLYPNARTLYCFFNDVDMATKDGPTEPEISRVLEFSASFTKADKILVHCLAGVSRSTALAFAVACQHSQPGEERKAMEYIRKLRPLLLPNRLIVITADRLLKRGGKMISASTPRGL